MGVGEEALGAHLAREGWSLKPGVLAHFGERPDLASARRALLDADLRRVGEPVARAGDAHLAGPVVLQVMAVMDISRPSRGAWRDPAGTRSTASGKGRTSGAAKESVSASKRSPRMLRVELTDGERALVGVEHETLNRIADEDTIPPGSKVLVPPGVVVRKVDGILLLRGDESLVPLGGRVAPLFKDWERARARKSGRADELSAAAKGAPAYRPYDPHDPHDPAAIEAAAEEKRAEAERVAHAAAAAAAAASAAALAEAPPLHILSYNLWFEHPDTFEAGGGVRWGRRHSSRTRLETCL